MLLTMLERVRKNSPLVRDNTFFKMFDSWANELQAEAARCN
jgi:hypothetical protein